MVDMVATVTKDTVDMVCISFKINVFFAEMHNQTKESIKKTYWTHRFSNWKKKIGNQGYGGYGQQGFGGFGGHGGTFCI